MKRVTGLGGVFFKTADPKKIKEWYVSIWVYQLMNTELLFGG
jgi:hypothetical protein